MGLQTSLPSLADMVLSVAALAASSDQVQAAAPRRTLLQGGSSATATQPPQPPATGGETPSLQPGTPYSGSSSGSSDDGGLSFGAKSAIIFVAIFTGALLVICIAAACYCRLARRRAARAGKYALPSSQPPQPTQPRRWWARLQRPPPATLQACAPSASFAGASGQAPEATCTPYSYTPKAAFAAPLSPRSLQPTSSTEASSGPSALSCDTALFGSRGRGQSQGALQSQAQAQGIHRAEVHLDLGEVRAAGSGVEVQSPLSPLPPQSPLPQSPRPPKPRRGVPGASALSQTAFLCPITKRIMLEPVVAADGNTYERQAIVDWMRHNTQGGRPVSPVTGQPLAHVTLVRNVVLLRSIHKWQNAQQQQRRSSQLQHP